MRSNKDRAVFPVGKTGRRNGFLPSLPGLGPRARLEPSIEMLGYYHMSLRDKKPLSLRQAKISVASGETDAVTL